MNQYMTYQIREGRRLIENDGNLALCVDEGNLIYTEIDQKKVFFESPFSPGNFLWARGWPGYHSWSWYAVEKVGNYIKLIDRNWLRTGTMNLYLGYKQDPNNIDYINSILYEVYNFSLDGKYISNDGPAFNPQGRGGVYKIGYESHVQDIENLTYRLYSPLESWVMNNNDLLREFIESAPGSTSIEDWAYNKYVELYPGEKVPSTYGIEGNYPSAENAYFGKKTLTGNFRDYKFYNRGSGKYEIKTDSGFDEITGMTLEFTDKTIDAVDDIKGVFDQVTGLNTDSGKMFRLYNAAFARFPDASGLQYWIGNFSSGKDDERAVASSFIASTEFKQRYGENVSNPKYVETLYTNVLGRDYDQSGYTYWLGNLNNGLETRYELLLGFSKSAEKKHSLQK